MSDLEPAGSPLDEPAGMDERVEQLSETSMTVYYRAGRLRAMGLDGVEHMLAGTLDALVVVDG